MAGPDLLSFVGSSATDSMNAGRLEGDLPMLLVLLLGIGAIMVSGIGAGRDREFDCNSHLFTPKGEGVFVDAICVRLIINTHKSRMPLNCGRFCCVC